MKKGNYDIFQASTAGDIAAAKEFLDNGVGINDSIIVYSNKEYTPLNFALNGTDNTKMVEFLLSHGATWSGNIPYTYCGPLLSSLNDIDKMVKHMCDLGSSNPGLHNADSSVKKYGLAVINRFKLKLQKEGLHFHFGVMINHLKNECNEFLIKEDLDAACKLLEDNMAAALDIVTSKITKMEGYEGAVNPLGLFDNNLDDESGEYCKDSQQDIWYDFLNKNDFTDFVTALSSDAGMNKTNKYVFFDAILEGFTRQDNIFFAEMYHHDELIFKQLNNCILPTALTKRLRKTIKEKAEFDSNNFSRLYQDDILALQLRFEEQDNEINKLHLALKSIESELKQLSGEYNSADLDEVDTTGSHDEMDAVGD